MYIQSKTRQNSHTWSLKWVVFNNILIFIIETEKFRILQLINMWGSF